MQNVKPWCVIFVLLVAGPSAARAQHACDPPPEGGRVMASTEVTDVNDGAPYQAGADLMVERTTRLMPL